MHAALTAMSTFSGGSSIVPSKKRKRAESSPNAFSIVRRALESLLSRNMKAMIKITNE